MKQVLIGLAAAAGIASGAAQAAPLVGLVFADWTGIDTGANTATGTVAGTTVFLSAAAAGDVRGGTTADDSIIFNNASYTPALALSDLVGLAGGPGGGWDYTITFGDAVLNPVMHLVSLASVLQFAAGTSITKLSGDASLGVAGASVSGVAAGSTDSNGTIQFNGTFTSLSFSASYTGGGGSEEFFLQIGATQIQAPAPLPGAVPEPASITLALGALALLGSSRGRHKRRARPSRTQAS